jgi:hypothetical protein
MARSRDRAVGIATGYGLDDREVGVRVPVGSKIFSSARRSDVCRLFLQLITDGGAVSVHNMQTHFHLPITIIKICLTVRYNRVRYNEVLLY